MGEDPGNQDLGKGAAVVPLDSRRKAASCPVCGKPAAIEHRPFCSDRCARIDLGRWLKGGYRIPTEERPPAGQIPDDEGA